MEVIKFHNVHYERQVIPGKNINVYVWEVFSL